MIPTSTLLYMQVARVYKIYATPNDIHAISDIHPLIYPSTKKKKKESILTKILYVLPSPFGTQWLRGNTNTI